ncbi:MAG: chemotaxis protein CheW [Candidatus Sulfotelmatobacter sp.]
MRTRTNTGATNRPQAAVDWQAVHHRLEAAGAAVERQLLLSEQDKKSLLKARATSLAALPQSEAAEEYLEIIEFQLATETYGIELRHAGEVSLLKELTPVPCTPAFVLGIINVHGRVLSVVDLKRFFDLPNNALTDLNRVIVVRKDGMEVGILADTIHGVRRIPRRELQPSLPTLTGIRAEYLKGITGERLIVLDADKLLSDSKIVVQEEPK